MQSSEDNMQIEHQIREFIAQNLLFSESGFQLDGDTSFLKEGVIDSLGVMELVTFVQRDFGVMVDPTDVTPEHFDSVNRLAQFVRRKQAPQPAAVATG